MVTLRFLRIVNACLVLLVCVPILCLSLCSVSKRALIPIVDVPTAEIEGGGNVLDLAPLFVLKSGRPSASIDTLKRFMVYYHGDQRPDGMRIDSQEIVLGFKDSQETIALAPGELVYVACDQGVLTFARDTGPLWLKACLENNKLKVRTGTTADTSLVEQMFTLEPTKSRANHGGWEVADISVDPSFLMRAKMRWYGLDTFLQDHGGEEYKERAEKQRIDIGEGESTYACFLKDGEGLIWDGARWIEQVLGEESRKSPLLYLESTTDQMLTFSLWDVGGRHSISLGLKIGNGCQQDPKHYRELTFCGARTLSQGVMRSGYDEWRVKPHDWLFYNGKTWEKVENRQHLEDYLNRRIEGELLIVDALYRKGSQEKLLAHCYNPSRTRRINVEIPKGDLKEQQHEFYEN